ncbi:MAG: signal peptidase I [Kiritimatiellia bacterium]|jgi:signal peptidase I
MSPKSIRKSAKNLSHDLLRVLNMNRDRFEPDVIQAFEDSLSTLSNLRRSNDEAALDASIEAGKALLDLHTPPRLSPVMTEIVETLVVAFGVAMAFRAFFFQPFKIPTGSMQPTLYGIHSVAAANPEKGPGILDRMPFKPLKWLVAGSWYRDVVAKEDGKVVVYTDNTRAPGYVLLTVAGERYKVPHDAFERREVKVPNAQPPGMADNPNDSRRTIASGFVRKGQRLWAGHITSGDQVFVNRLAWNFGRPRRDDVIVFATSEPQLAFGEADARAKAKPVSAVVKIPKLPLYLIDTPIRGLLPGQHFIKRLVGLPGETVSVRHPHVYVDGNKVEGLPGMDRVAAMRPSTPGGTAYAGYHNTGDAGMPPTSGSCLHTPGQSITLGDAYLPMGDNTLNSWDGRYWGGVPRTQMLGPGACVYWPLSRRWGRLR